MDMDRLMVESFVHDATVRKRLYIRGFEDGLLRLFELGPLLCLEEVISRLGGVRKLSVRLCGVTQTEEDCDDLIDVLQATLPTLTNLTALELTQNNLRVEQTQRLGGVVSFSTKLLKLELSRNRIETTGVQAMGLASLVNLWDLSLDGNQLDTAAAGVLAEALPSLTRLVYLRLKDNQLGVDGMKLLAPALPPLQNLRSFNLRNNQLTGEGVQALQGYLPLLPNLRLLNLSENRLGEQVELLAGALPFMSKITHLFLWKNHFGPHGVRVLAKPLLLTDLTSVKMGYPGSPDSPSDVDWQLLVEGLDIPNHHLERGWNATLEFAREHRSRLVAIVMGKHKRLGARSYLHRLEEELLRVIINMG
jgi:hypothetical protein